MRNPSRRNRNIGTAAQGYGQNNKLAITTSYANSKSFFERLGTYEKTERVINGHTFLFVVEQTFSNCVHACTLEDIARMLTYIPKEDFGELKLIVLRQPRLKEKILSPVWGRMIYSFEFENDYYPAIVLEAIKINDRLRWKRGLGIEDQQELDRLKRDGHIFIEDKRSYTTRLDPEAVRNTQLYRTLLHEFGHYVQYFNLVKKPETENESTEVWEKRNDDYSAIPSTVKERFAHQYADHLSGVLRSRELIPFERISL